MSDVTRYKIRVEGKHDKVCPACGVAFKGQAVTVYCSHACKVRNRTRREAASSGRYYQLPKDYQRPDRLSCTVSYPTCVECGNVFCAHRGTGRTWCSTICRDSYQAEIRRAWYEANAETIRAEARRAWRKSAEGLTAYHHEGECPECGAQFIGHGRMQYCSGKCRKRALRRAHPRPGGNWNHRHLKRVAERDGWICHLCGKRVAPGQESVDHLVPRSAGGPDRMDNVALAHHRCNTLRRAGGKAQLRLLG